ncbi:MAG: DUF2029 domain-containing protein [Anaerolineae bacterium]|nr:DUF2029 domain-containing protein [Anaerolineae bacterium]
MNSIMNNAQALTSLPVKIKSVLTNALRISTLVSDPDEMDRNLRRKPGAGEFIGLLIGLWTLGITLWLHLTGHTVLIDYTYFTDSAGGTLDHFFMGFWIMPIFKFLRLLPVPVGYVLWGLLNLAGVWFAARVFRANATWALLVYQLLYMLYYGQISGLIAGGLGLAWYGLVHRKWDWAGLGFLIAGAKPQTGLMAGGLLWLMVPLPWKHKLRLLVVPSLGVLLSLLIYPHWPAQILDEWRVVQPNDFASITFWRWIGPAGLLLILPPLLVNLDWQRRTIALVCACTLAFPYFQQADLLILYVLPVGALPVLGNLGFLYPWFQWDALKLMAVVPLSIYLLILIPAFAARLRKDRAASTG